MRKKVLTCVSAQGRGVARERDDAEAGLEVAQPNHSSQHEDDGEAVQHRVERSQAIHVLNPLEHLLEIFQPAAASRKFEEPRLSLQIAVDIDPARRRDPNS